MNYATYILRALRAEGIRHFFMVPGKLINPFMSNYRLDHAEDIAPVVAAFEGGAVMMADGYARAGGGIGVAIMLDGPGVANAVGGMSNAFADGYPVLLLSGQIPRDYEMMGALQDSTPSGLNQTATLAPITRHSFHVRNGANLPRYLREVLKGLSSPDGLPSYLSIAKDVLLSPATESYRPLPSGLKRPPFSDRDAARSAFQSLRLGGSVVVLAGSRASRPGVGTALRRISEKYDVAVATTVGSKGVFPETHDNYLGVYGYSGHHRAIRMLTEDPPDTLILLGFDTTQWTSLAWDPALRPARTLIQVGTRPGDIDFVIPADIAVVSDEEVFLRDLEASGVLSASRADNRAYLDRAAGWPLLHPVEPVDDGHLHPADVVLALNRLLPDHICIADSGNHRSFATHYWRTDIQNGFFSANTICGMGWAIPAAVGVSFARDEPCVVITGDGCMLMHGMEIQTAARYRRPVIYVVFNNSSYGATYFNNIHNIPEMSALPTHDWAMFARSLGAAGHRVTSLDELEEAVVAARAATGATVIDVLCSKLPETPAHRYKQNVKSSGVL